MGGVIGLYTINYNSDKKGGAHERRQEAIGVVQVNADGVLSFGSIDAACEFLGCAFSPADRQDAENCPVCRESESGSGQFDGNSRIRIDNRYSQLPFAEQRFILSEFCAFNKLQIPDIFKYIGFEDCLPDNECQRLGNMAYPVIYNKDLRYDDRKEVAA